MKFSLPPIYFLIFTILSGCMTKHNFSGEYHLTGVHEMASAFNFNPDGKFEFYLVYGAMDRNASGTYTVDGDTIKIHSDKEAGNDFAIVNQRQEGTGYTIRILNENSILASNVLCFYFVNGQQFEAYSDSDGLIKIDAPVCEKIYVQHMLFADVASLIKDDTNANNYFELNLRPEIQQVSFKGIDFFIDGDALTCLPNYFLPMENIRFERSSR